MIKIMKNTAKILLRRKSFVLTTFILPIILIFAITSLYNSAENLNIGVINNDKGELGHVIEDKLSNMDLSNITDLSQGDYTQSLIFHKYEMIITIDEDFTEKLLNGDLSEIKYQSLTENDTSQVIKNMLESETSSLANICNNINVNNDGITNVIKAFNEDKPDYKIENDEDAKVKISQDSMGIIFYIIFVSASIGCGFLLEDERQGTKERALMGNIGEKQYFAGLGILFFLFAAVPSFEYYIISNLLDLDFGFEHKILLLPIILLMSLLAVSLSIMLSSIIKNKPVFTMTLSALSIPMFMLSGSFWPYDLMSITLQKIGSILPPRWIFLAIENLQKGNGISSILPMVGGVLLLSILLFILSIFFTKNKVVLVKDNN
ncbi:ABC transporter permease [Clostridium sp. SHJSY1]|uniref:ABC transporter permease n=1 Tax=Clostridium sp. SHJSY1 TaxID=2942483 RepID=UPI0028751E3B|nr:ABC transporter permease [Clostridium sp. SHJSY1]MDS0524266.1 ABC transporter permease [Clostridium sp. SHJSY1]